jgi:hypothetical protein
MIVSNVKMIESAERVQLIEEVRTKPSIWSSNDSNHANKQILTKLWLDVKTAMDTEERSFPGINPNIKTH